MRLALALSVDADRRYRTRVGNNNDYAEKNLNALFIKYCLPVSNPS
jgi:hypothetical protein